jgi:thiol-disulfide isomerase/thioredoxin
MNQGIIMFFQQPVTQRRIGVTSLALALTLGLGWTAWTRAQAPEGKTLELKTVKPDARHDDVKARALFDEVSKAYKALNSYSDKGEFVLAIRNGTKKERQSLPLNLTFVRPNKVNLDAGQVRLTSDGTSLTTTVIPFKRYTTAPAPQKLGFETFREGPIGSVLFGGPSAPAMFVLLNLLTAPDPAAAIAQLGGTLQTVAPPEAKPADGANATNPEILIDLGQGKPGIVLTVNPATKLLSSIDLKIDPEQLVRGTPPGQTLSIDRFGWKAGAVSTELAQDQAFAYQAPKGFTKVDSLAGDQQEKHAADSKVGKPAPDFTLTLLDGPGKTKTVTKAELAGKVVVIDFWATWCPPCMMELPEIAKLIDSYADSKKEVVVVALSQDSNPAELAEVRKLVEKTLGDKKINLTGNPVGTIGLDPSNSVSAAFGVDAFPTLVILDGKGIVQSVHVGYNPEATEPLHKSLAKEINAIVDGKSPAGPDTNAKDAKKKS